MAIRQEINIINSIVTASGDHSAIVRLDADAYTGATFYFETVAQVSSGTLTVTLQRVGTAAEDATTTVTQTSYTRQTRDAFTPPSGVTYYNINLSGGTGPSVKAARIIILQSADPLTLTQTQIEIGNEETGKSNTATAALTNPKYWLYDSSKWDGTPTFKVQASFKHIQVASSTTYGTSATTTDTYYTYIGSRGVSYVTVEAWGAGGGGSIGNAGGGGGGGGAYARSTTTVAAGSVNILGVGGGGEDDPTTAGAAASSTYTGAGGSIVRAAGGSATNGNTAGAGGVDTSPTTGQVVFAGGGGGVGNTGSDVGGGGGGAAGPHGAGVTASGAGSGAPTAGGAGDNSLGGAGGAAGTGDGASCPTSAGKAGVDNPLGAGGGGGADGSGTNTCTGGTGGKPGGGGGSSELASAVQFGGPGQIIIKETHGMTGIALEEDDGSFGVWSFLAQLTASTLATSTSATTSLVSFTPNNGRHYRLVASTTNASATYDIYNAKIIVDQTSPTLLEPQYLLLNTADSGSTGLQNYQTLYDANEWSGSTNTYLVSHDATNASDSSKLVDITATPDTDLTNGSVTGANQQIGTSGITDLIDDREIDVNVTNTTGVVGASRILAQVAPTPAAITVSGNAYENDSGTTALNACDGSTPNIKLIVATSTPGQYSTTCDNTTGAWGPINIGTSAPAASTTMIAYLDGSAQTYGALVSLHRGSGNVAGLTLRASTTILDYDSADGPIQTQDFDRWDNGQDTDIPWVVTADGLTFEQNTKWFIGTSTVAANAVNFAASSTASTTPGGTFARGGDVQITSGSTLNMGTNNLTVGGDLMNFGTLSVSSGNTVTFNGTRSGGNGFDLGSNQSLQGLTVSGSVAITASSSVSAAGTLTVNSGSELAIRSGKFATSTATLTLSGTISGAGTLVITDTSSGPGGSGTLSAPVRYDATTADIPSTALDARSGGSAYTGLVEIYSGSGSARNATFAAGTYAFNAGLNVVAAGTGNITTLGTPNFPTVSVGATSGDFDFTGVGAGSEVIYSGTGAWTVSGNTDFTGGFFLASSTNVFTMDGASKTLTSNQQGFGGLTLSGSVTTVGEATSTGPLVLSGTVTLGNAASTTGTATLSGTISPNTQSVVLNGVSQTLTGGGTVGGLIVNGSYTLSSADISMASTTVQSGGTLTLGSGRFATSTASLTLWGTLDGAGTTTIQHSSLNTGGTLNANVRFDPSSANLNIPIRSYGGDIEIYNSSASWRIVHVNSGTFSPSKALMVNASGAGKATLSATTTNAVLSVATTTYIGSGSGQEEMLAGSGNWTLSGNLVTSGGLFTGSSATTSVAGNYTNSGGTFTANSGVFLLNGSNQQTITGNATATSAFYDLAITNTSGGGDATNTPSVIFTDSASTTNTFFVTTANVTSRLAASKLFTFQNINWDGKTAGQEFKPRSSSSGTQFTVAIPGSRFATSRVDFMDMSVSGTALDASDGTNINSGNNTGVTFPAAFQASTIVSAANQVFVAAQATTSISQITVTAGAGAGAITVANDFRIAIATSTSLIPTPPILVKMHWDYDDTSATIGGSQSCTVGSTVSYEGPDRSVLLVPITGSNCNANDTITISGLSYAGFDTVNASTTALYLLLDGASDQTENASTTAQYVAIKGAEVLADHASSQESNKFDIGAATSLTDAELFAFKLTPSAESVSVSQIVFTLSQIQGFVSSDITGAAVFVDYNGNKEIDGGDLPVGGAGTVAISGADGTITFSSSFSTSTARDYILQADVAGIGGGNELTVNLTASNITVSGGTSLQGLTPSGSATALRHSKPAGGGTSVGPSAPAGAGTATGGGSGGGGEEGSAPPPANPPATGGGGGGGGETRLAPWQFFAGLVSALGDISRLLELFK